MLYYRRKQERASDRLSLKLPLKVVVSLADGFSFPIGPSQGVCLLISPLFYGVGLVVLPITEVIFMVISFLTTGKDP